MQVFKTFLKIARKRIPAVSIYIVIFLAITIIMSVNSAKDSAFEDTKLNISVIDLDDTAESHALTDYISSKHKIVKIENDKDEILDALYYVTVDYVLTIKDGYAEKITNGETDGLFTNNKVPDSYRGEFFDNDLDKYVSTLSAYITSGYDIDEAIDKTAQLSDEQTEVNKANFARENDSDYQQDIYYYFQYLPYIFLSVLIAGLCPILLVLTKKEIKNRVNCSSVSSTNQTMQLVLGTTIFVFGMWLIFMIAAAILYGGPLFNSKGLLAMLNSLVFLIVASAITLLIATLSPNPKAVDMMANTIGLGMSFLCGIFVPQWLLGDTVLSIAKFLPAYWFVRANDMLAGTSGETYEAGKYFEYLGVELIFAVALYALILLLSKVRRKSS